jgi:hypothetical protein
MPTYIGMRKVDANCITCGLEWHTPNAQGVAAVHARKYGHEVAVDVYQAITYRG